MKRLKELCFDYITRPCRSNDGILWIDCPLFCLPFKIYDKVETNTYWYCTCKPFICQKYCHNIDHQRVAKCYNCNINGDCSKLDGHWQHCIRYDCDAWAIRDNLAEICGQLMQDKDNIYNICYTLNKLFTLLFCYWGFGKPDKENYNPYFDQLNVSLPAFVTCRCTWEIHLKK